MGIPRIQAFFKGRSNLQLFCKSQYMHTFLQSCIPPGQVQNELSDSEKGKLRTLHAFGKRTYIHKYMHAYTHTPHQKKKTCIHAILTEGVENGQSDSERGTFHAFGKRTYIHTCIHTILSGGVGNGQSDSEKG